MTDTKQPEALSLADQYRDHGGADMSHFDHIEWAQQAEHVLRNQDARITELEQYEKAYQVWMEKTAWVRKTVTEKNFMKHSADILRERIEALEADSRALKEQLEAIGAGGVTGLRAQAPNSYPPLPERPEPDGQLTIRVMGKDYEVNAYRDSTVADYVMACIDADRAHRAAIAQEGGK